MPDTAATFRISERHYLLSNRLTFRRMIGSRLAPLGILLAVFGVLVAVQFISFEVWLGGTVGGVIALSAILAFQYFLYLPRQANKDYRESVSLQEEMTLSTDETAIKIEQHSGVICLKWQDVSKWDETSELLTIHPNRTISHILPKDQIEPSTIDYVRQRLIAFGLLKPGTLRK